MNNLNPTVDEWLGATLTKMYSELDVMYRDLEVTQDPDTRRDMNQEIDRLEGRIDDVQQWPECHMHGHDRATQVHEGEEWTYCRRCRRVLA